MNHTKECLAVGSERVSVKFLELVGWPFKSGIKGALIQGELFGFETDDGDWRGRLSGETAEKDCR